MVYIPADLRRQVIERAHGICEYCQAQSDIVIDMEIDHIIPTSTGGTTVLENLCLTCAGCNNFKHHFQLGIDPETGQQVALFNPRIQKWTEHFAWSEDKLSLIGKTTIGKATINRLKMNRQNAITARRRWVAAGWHPPKLSAE